jgi:signal transduction histidine kinase
MTLRFWPQSLFGRLMAASIIALLLAQVVSLVIIARERERFILQGSVREWSRRIEEVTVMLQGMDDTDRSATISRLIERPWRFMRRPPDAFLLREGLGNGFGGDPEHFPGPGGHGARKGQDRPPEALEAVPARPGEPSTPPDVPPEVLHGGHGPQQAGPDRPEGHRNPQGHHSMGPPEDSRSLVLRATTYPTVVPFTKAGDLEPTFEEELRKDLGPGFETEVTQTAEPTKNAVPIGGPLFTEAHDSGAEFYDAKVRFPDGYTAVFRVTRYSRGAPLPRGLFMNVALLVLVMSIALWVVARSITRPLSELARAADSVGRDLRQPKLAERGAREIRNAARAFNTMQDRMQRYLDSRSRVLAAMSHDLKTPLTRLRLQVEMLDDSAAQGKLGRQLDEMESMVHGALALFRGLDDKEAFTPIDINELLATLQSEFAEMSSQVSIQGQAVRSILAKPQALRRCLTNLIANAVKFGSQATVIVEDGASLVIRIRDAGPGIPAEELERVFEPFYRLESSRNRDTGGSGLGLSIARDVIQAHGGALILQNLPVRGLEAVVTLPRT